MPRSARPIPEEGCLHIMCRGNNRQYIFLCGDDFQYYYELLHDLKEENRIAIYHYCLMSNHIHIIAGVGEESSLSRYMKQVNLGYYYYYKRQHDYCGHLWQGRYKSCIIETDIYLLQCGKYIELNPVRAGMVELPEQYGHSSYGYYSAGRRDRLVTENPLYTRLGPTGKQRQLAYRDFVLSDDIKKRLGMEKFVGTREFIGKHETQFCTKNTRLRRGRPRKDEK